MNEIPQLNCKRCNYSWTPRVSISPKLCPRCKSHKWNEAKDKKEEEF